MGRGRILRNKDKNFAQKRRARENKWDEKAPRKSYDDIIRENADFEKYYKIQQICPVNEWNAFMDSIKKNLPTAFRITGYKSEARVLLKIVKSEFFQAFLNPNQGHENTSSESLEESLKPICLPWYPDNLGWQLQLTRKDIRRSEIYFRLHNFLISETDCGNISRQEVVSMIPPLVLDVKPHHKVLDMCAAPGSKTAQLIEMLHAEDGKLPEGVVVANDVDNNRCYMLVHQAKRLNSPCIVITNHDSSVMPNLMVSKEAGDEKEYMKFDRILCDVPCSGDGTLRKNPDIWLKWNTANGNNLHGIQFRIAKRGLEMLTIGGRMVYSTCSLNPLEDEAVMHRLLVEAQGAVQLVDVSALVPGLVYSKGISKWYPGSKDLMCYSKFDDVPEKWHTIIRPQMFPPSPEDAPNFYLDRCIRLLPHQQDTGGFFVAVLEKIAALPWESKSASENNEGKSDTPTSPREPQRKRRRGMGYKEDPFIFFSDEEPLWPSIRDFYDIDKTLKPTCFLTRCKEGKKKNIYFTSSGVRDIVVNNEDKIKLINTGVKTFVRCDNKSMECSFRLAQEGLHSIYPYIGPKRKIKVTREDLILLLTCEDPKFPPEIETLNITTQDQVKNISPGSCVLEYEEKCSDSESSLSLKMVGWRGTKSVRAYVPQNDCVHYLRLVGADISKFEKNKFKKSQDEANSLKEDSEKLTEMDVDDEVKNNDFSCITNDSNEEQECNKCDRTKPDDDITKEEG